MGTTSAQKKLFFNLRKAKARIGVMEEGDLRPEHLERIAEDLGVSQDEVTTMNRRLSGSDASLNAQVKTDGEGATEWQDWLEDESADHAAIFEEDEELRERSNFLMEAMEGLTEREKTIIQKRRLSDEPATLEDLSKIFSVSRERIRQIEGRAFEKLQIKVTSLEAEKSQASELERMTI